MRWSHGQIAVASICLAAAGLIGAACGGDDGAAVVETTASAPVSSEISVEAAAEQYMTLVAAPNCAIDELNAAIHDVASTPSGAVSDDEWPAIQATVVPALVKVKETGRDWATALLKAEWPEGAASDVEALALAVTDSANRYGEIADAQDFDSFFEIYNSEDTTAVFGASSDAAETVREDLGLDSETTDPPDWCSLATPA